MRRLLVVGLLLTGCPVHAQGVRRVPDVASYATAAINPTWAAVDAWRSPERLCRFERLALSEAIGNGVALTLKHFIVSPRPCLACAPDGFPSGHTMNSAIGLSDHWRMGVGFTVGTAGLRIAARRHTVWQVTAGALLGLSAEAAGRLIGC